MKKFLFVAALLGSLAGPGRADFKNGQSTDLAFGGPTIFSQIQGIAVDGRGQIYVCDAGFNRVLVYPGGMVTGDGQLPIAVLGQASMDGKLANKGAAQPSATSLSGPSSVAFSGGFLFVADRGNNRVLIYDTVTSNITTDQAAMAVLGQQNFTAAAAARSATGLNSPYGITVEPLGNVWVADSGNQRVVRFPSYTTGSAADYVLGQSSLTASGGGAMSFPIGVTIGSSNALYVADEVWNQVLRYNTAGFKPLGSPPDGLLGQSFFGSIGAGSGPTGLNTPWGAAADAQGDLWVADTHNNRVIRYNNAANKANGAAADLVLGQPNLTDISGGAGDNDLASPTGICVDSDGDVWVCDYDNHRVMRFSALEGPRCKLGSASLKTVGKKIKLTVKGSASGGSGILYVEYSVDGGKKWKKAKGKTKWQFSTTIKAGALKVQVRAVDTRKVKSAVLKLKGKDFKKLKFRN
ncbi:MAG: NHL repeat-containing protein [Chthoniobacterales bacterium]